MLVQKSNKHFQINRVLIHFLFKYLKFLVLIPKLADHSYSKRDQDFLKNFLVPFVPPIKLSDIKAVFVHL